jgi:hypothetical protein
LRAPGGRGRAGVERESVVDELVGVISVNLVQLDLPESPR